MPHVDAAVSAARFEAARVAAIRATDEYRRLAQEPGHVTERKSLADDVRRRTHEAVEELERLLASCRHS